MPTVEEVADELGVTSAELLERLERMGRPGFSRSSSLDVASLDRLRADVSASNGDPLALTTSNGGRPSRDSPDERPPGEESPEHVPPAGASASGAGTSHPSTPSIVHIDSRNLDPDHARTALESPIRRPSRGSEKPKEGSTRPWIKQLTELPLLIVFAFLIAVVIKTFLVQAFYIPSASMNPTLQRNDRVLVEKVSGYFTDPEPGQVIVFEREGVAPPTDESLFERGRDFFRELLGLPTGSEEDYIKRVVATGGDEIRYQGRPRQLYVNGRRVAEPYLKQGRDMSSQPIAPGNCDSVGLQPASKGCRVPAGTLYVMGDNRSNSQDSRFIGPVEEDKVIGHAFVLIWPFSRFGGL